MLTIESATLGEGALDSLRKYPQVTGSPSSSPTDATGDLHSGWPTGQRGPMIRLRCQEEAVQRAFVGARDGFARWAGSDISTSEVYERTGLTRSQNSEIEVTARRT